MEINPILIDAVIRFVRVVVAAGLVAFADSLGTVDFTLGLQGVLAYLGAAILTAGIHAAMEFIRNWFGSQIPVVSSKPRAGAQQARAKTIWDYSPI